MIALLDTAWPRRGGRPGCGLIPVRSRRRASAWKARGAAEFPYKAGNFRDFSAAVERMATLAEGGRVGVPLVREEIGRLTAAWHRPAATDTDSPIGRYLDAAATATLDRFDRVQLADVLRVCESAKSLSDAGRTLFSESHKRRSSHNDADRMRKYLARFGLSWSDLHP